MDVDQWMALPIEKRRALIRKTDPAPKRRLAIARKFRKARTRLVRTGGWDALFERQGSRCGICGTTEQKHAKGWATDHCHKTGAIRGILCTKCNSGLGGFDDNIEKLAAAIAYLRKPPAM